MAGNPKKDAERAFDAMIAKAVAAMERYGVTDPYDPRLNLEDFAALQKELKGFWPRRPRRSKYSLADNALIMARLSQAEGTPGGAAQEAEVLFNEMKADGHSVASAEILRQHYHKLKKEMLEAHYKFEREHGIDDV